MKKKIRKKKKTHVIDLPNKKIIRKVNHNVNLNISPTSLYNGQILILSKKGSTVSRKHMIYLKQLIMKRFRKFKKKLSYKLLLRSMYDRPFTQKSKHSRMGKGKGKIKSSFSRLNQFDPLYEIRFERFRRFRRYSKSKLKKKILNNHINKWFSLFCRHDLNHRFPIKTIAYPFDFKKKYDKRKNQSIGCR